MSDIFSLDDGGADVESKVRELEALLENHSNYFKKTVEAIQSIQKDIGKLAQQDEQQAISQADLKARLDKTIAEMNVVGTQLAMMEKQFNAVLGRSTTNVTTVAGDVAGDVGQEITK